MANNQQQQPPADATAAVVAKLTAKLKKLADDNSKYKNLLKLAKERIQQQENEIEGMKDAQTRLESQLSNTQEQLQQLQQPDEDSVSTASLESQSDSETVGSGAHIIRVCQATKETNGRGIEEVWALFELEPTKGGTTHKAWVRFDTETQLRDHVKRETKGREPLPLPAFSLTPEQSSQMKQQSKQEMTALSEEFRRYRVKAELARKQADAHIRDLQNSQKLSASQQIEGPTNNSKGSKESEGRLPLQTKANGIDHTRRSVRASMDQSQAETLRAELATQEAYWKQAYNTLLAENNALKSSGSENLIASQWRQRYEQSQQEKEDLLQKVNQMNGTADAQKYEEKYKDLKESFKLYRKKAKEIFQSSPLAAGDPALLNAGAGADGSADAKLDYLRNLMVNYLTAEPEMQNHMERAIGTLLKFSPDDCARIESKRQQVVVEKENWFF